MTGVLPSASSGAGGQSNRITATVTKQGGQNVVKLSYQGETVPLVDSGSLNRWAAVGIVDRHKIAVFQDHLTIDGHDFLLDDPDTTGQLERILNRPEAPPHSHTPASSAGAHATATAPVSDAAFLENLAETLRVTRDGFEYHVIFRTRFGETKTEKLDRALEVLQTMRAFKPHINLQKSGIRLVVTRWDGESFIEEPGIENFEHASPEQVEELIRRNLLGSPAYTANAPRPGRAGRPPVTRVEIVKKPHDARFHLVFHRQDGSTEDGPVLIRANMAKLAADRVFRPDVSVSVTAMSDRLVIGRQPKVGGKAVVEEEMVPLTTIEDAKRAEALLNELLNPAAEESSVAELADVVPSTQEDHPNIPPPVPPNVPDRVTRFPPDTTPSAAVLLPVAAASTEESATPSAVQASPAPEFQATPAPARTEAKIAPERWMREALAATASLPIDEVNRAIFAAVHERFDRPIVPNDHEFPAFTLDAPGPEGNAVRLEFVLTPHYLLCQYPFGYVRFGPETRLFLTRLDDYAAFSQPALRGIVQSPSGALAFIVSNEFAQFLQTHADRSYKARFADLLLGIEQVDPGHELIWPPSREGRLFEMLAATAKTYALPVTRDTIVLDPKPEEFIGFRSVAPHGIEFRDGEDYVRFTPRQVEFHEDTESIHFEGEGVLFGWALDQEGRVCALYRTASGFTPPEHAKLLRFVSEVEREQERDSLNVLAELP